MDDTLAALRAALSPGGLNVVGVAAVDAYDAAAAPASRSSAVLPGARALVVVGSGGPGLWHAFLAALEADPGCLTREEHPLEAFVQRSIEAADPALGGVARRWLFASSTAPAVDLRLAGALAGLGAPSRLGLLMHPVHGPWLGLRAACFVAADLPVDPPGGPDRCAGCAAPCISACPGGAFPAGSWDVHRCAAFHVESSVCAASCAARLACPEGAFSRYPADEILYHYDPAAGRRLLRERLGLPAGADAHEGSAVPWAAWKR